MSQSLLSAYYTSELPDIIEKLDEYYYQVVEQYCDNIETNTSKFLESGDEHASVKLYVSLCIKLVEKIRHHMRMRKLVTMPYIYELHEKVVSEHDCSTCSDGCSIGHGAKLNSIKEAHQHIKEIFYRLQMVATPLYEEENAAGVYKKLRNEIVQIDTKLTEMFYLEEAVLLPKMKEAQRKIHVHS